jgi:hypothetical protein
MSMPTVRRLPLGGVEVTFGRAGTKVVAEGLSDDEARGLCAALVAAYGNATETPDGSSGASVLTIEALLAKYDQAREAALPPEEEEGIYHEAADALAHEEGLKAVAEMAVKAASAPMPEDAHKRFGRVGYVAAQVDAERGRALRAEAEVERLRGYLERANRELGEVAKALGCDPKDTPLGLGAVAEAAKRFAEKHRCGTFENPGGGVRQCTKERRHKGKHAFDMAEPPLTKEQLDAAFNGEGG